MVTPKIYIDANAPTVAEGAIRGAYWYGVNPYQTIEKSIDHATQYAVPKGEYRNFKEDCSMKYTVKQLTSGFWAVFAGNVWIDAAQPTKQAALELISRLKKEANRS